MSLVLALPYILLLGKGEDAIIVSLADEIGGLPGRGQLISRTLPAMIILLNLIYLQRLGQFFVNLG